MGSWKASAPFGPPRYGHSSVAYNGYLYVLGGWSGSAFLNDVQYAAFNGDGSLTTWFTTTSFSVPRWGQTAVAYGGYIYVLGGHNGSDLSDVQFAAVNAEGKVGDWTTTLSFDEPRYGHASVAYNGYLYVLGGIKAGVYLKDVQYTALNANGTVAGWKYAEPFFNERCMHTSVAANGILYVLGGTNTAALNDVQFAHVNGKGRLDGWNPANPLPLPLAGQGMVVYNGYLYSTGGQTTGHVDVTDVLFAPLYPDGSVGTWTSTTSFTTARDGHATVAYDGYIYVIAGETAGATSLSDVQYARIYPDGTVGTWYASTPLATSRWCPSAVV